MSDFGEGRSVGLSGENKKSEVMLTQRNLSFYRYIIEPIIRIFTTHGRKIYQTYIINSGFGSE